MKTMRLTQNVIFNVFSCLYSEYSFLQKIKKKWNGKWNAFAWHVNVNKYLQIYKINIYI